MSDAAAPAPAEPKKAAKPKAKAKPKKPATHPKYSDMIKEAITSLKERGGSSRQAILKYIMKDYNVGKDEKIVNSHLKVALRAGVKSGKLKQAKGTGASGSFRLGDKVKEAKPKKKEAAKKPKIEPKKAKKPKATAAKKAKVVKKAKSPKKAKAAKKPKSPKKAAPKKPKSPKKAAAKKPKAAKAKKAVAKKAKK